LKLYHGTNQKQPKPDQGGYWFTRHKHIARWYGNNIFEITKPPGLDVLYLPKELGFVCDHNLREVRRLVVHRVLYLNSLLEADLIHTAWTRGAECVVLPDCTNQTNHLSFVLKSLPETFYCCGA
jgi:hypothetical protein